MNIGEADRKHKGRLDLEAGVLTIREGAHFELNLTAEEESRGKSYVWIAVNIDQAKL